MKLTRCLTPVSPFDVPGVESWLQDMSARGLRLIRFRPLFCTFMRCEPEQRRYRVEACRHTLSGEVPVPMRDLYGEFGWDYMDTLGGGLLLFSSTDPDAPEPHSDPGIQAEAWIKVRRSKALNCLLNLLLCMAVLASQVIAGWHNGFLHTLILNSGTSLCFAFVFFLFCLSGEWRDLQRVNRIVLQLREGTPLDHHTVWPRRSLGTVISFSCAVLLLLCNLVFLHPPFQGQSIKPLDSLSVFEPLTLEELGTEPVVSQGRDYGNYVRQEPLKLLCWNGWEVVQTGINTPDLWERLEIRWYELPFSFVSAPLARELFDTSRKLDRDIWWHANGPVSWTADWPDVKGADFFALARTQEGNFQVACAAHGRQIVVVRWTGTEDLHNHLNAIAHMICDE